MLLKHLQKKKRRTGRLARPAGNKFKPDKGMAGSGAIGERLVEGQDPQSNTAAQRSWLYSEDVMFSAPKDRPPEETRCYATLNVKGDGKDAMPGPRTNDTTAHGMNIFNNALIPAI